MGIGLDLRLGLGFVWFRFRVGFMVRRKIFFVNQEGYGLVLGLRVGLGSSLWLGLG